MIDFVTNSHQDFCESKIVSLSRAINLLVDGYHYSSDSRRNIWDFAVSLDELIRTGAQINDLRWLISRGWLQHGFDVTPPFESERIVTPCNSFTFNATSCFALTSNGIDVVSSTFRVRDPMEAYNTPTPEVSSACITPNWDNERHELTLGTTLVKRFRWPAENQVAILIAFQEEGWPNRIDDPIPPIAEIDPKRRLADTIKCLNRNHVCSAIRFRGDGTGEGILWDLLSK